MNTILKALLYPFFKRIVVMPGKSYQGAMLPLTDAEGKIRHNLVHHVHQLAVEIGERSVRKGLEESAQLVERNFRRMGYEPRSHEFTVDGHKQRNIEVEIAGCKYPGEIIVIGAHYDTQFDTPGADDNASGVAALFEIARLLKGSNPERTIRFVAFANEEHPLNPTGWDAMGSYFYAKRCRKRNENVAGMLSLEMLAVYSDKPGSQKYPFPLNLFYPSVGNFIGFVGNSASRPLVHQCITSFRGHTSFPSEGGAAPELFKDIGRSDHWGFWQFGYQAIMVTDTSNFRYSLYHTPGDTPDKLDFGRFAVVTAGLARTIEELASS